MWCLLRSSSTNTLGSIEKPIPTTFFVHLPPSFKPQKFPNPSTLPQSNGIFFNFGSVEPSTLRHDKCTLTYWPVLPLPTAIKFVVKAQNQILQLWICSLKFFQTEHYKHTFNTKYQHSTVAQNWERCITQSTIQLSTYVAYSNPA